MAAKKEANREEMSIPAVFKRKEYLSKLDSIFKKTNIVALIGPRGCGKTNLIKQHINSSSKNKNKNNLLVYIDLKTASISPEKFALDFIGTIAWNFFSKNKLDLFKYQDLETIKNLELNDDCLNILNIIENELQKIKPDQNLILNSAFKFPDLFSNQIKKELIICLDNFDEFISMNNYSQITNILDLFFNSTSKSKTSKFLLASFSVWRFKHLFDKYIQNKNLNLVEMNYFSSKESEEFIIKHLNIKLDKSVINKLINYSCGIPLIINSLAVQSAKHNFSITQLKHFFISELINPDSEIYRLCQNNYEISLNNARGAALLKIILKTISQNPNLRLTEIANKIYRSGPVTKSLLERLIEVDIIQKQDSVFLFSQNIMKFWCRFVFNNIQSTIRLDNKQEPFDFDKLDEWLEE